MSSSKASPRSSVIPAAVAVGVVLATLAALTNTTQALPLFGRKYGLQCTACHLAAPRLNLFGMNFKQNGYRMPGATGESPWDSTAKEFPLALVGNVAYHFTSTNTEIAPGTFQRTNFGAFEQQQVEFHTAGTLASRVTFHFDNNFAGAGGPLQSGMAFVQLDDVAQNGGLNIKAGIYDADIPYLADSRKTTLTGYLSPVTLAAAGIELNGTRSNWMYALGVINSSRDTASVSASKPGQKTFNQLENPYAWVTRQIGTNMVTARVYLDRQNPPAASGKTASNHVQAEVNGYIDRGRFILIPGYTFESMQDQASGTPDKLHTGLLEAMWMMDRATHWVLTARYEHQYAPKSNGSTGVLDRGQAVLNVAYYINSNARFGIDWGHLSNNFHDPAQPGTDDVRAFVWVGY